jgi:hypothetical protein
MLKSSQAITLALIGSAFLVGGCNRDDDENNNQVAGGGRVYVAPRVGGGFGGGGSNVGATPSARGGFGSTGASSIGS